METPCFLRSGSAGDMTLTTLGPMIGFLIPKNMAMCPLVHRRYQEMENRPQPRLQ